MSRVRFGTTWWGRAWVDALEQRARLDPNRLPRGRTYARTGRVGTLTITSGEVRAGVQGSRVTPYVVHVRVRAFSDDEWDRLLDAVASKAAHTAALLDGELPSSVVADAAAAGLDLLPGPGEIGPRCSCPDWANPCKHAAAVVYLVAGALDADPFALLQLRGRSRAEVLAGLRQRRADGGRSLSAVAARAADAGVLAREAWSGPALGGLPAVPLPPRRPGGPAPLPVDPPLGSGVRREDLQSLAGDAAQRAWALCVGEGDGGLGLDPDLDVVRRAALAGPTLGVFADRAGVSVRQLARRAAAWRVGGADAVGVIDRAWKPDPEVVAEGSLALASAGRVQTSNNRVTVASVGVQLRLSPSGVWYRFERAGGGWELIDGPAADPRDLLG